MKTLIRRHMLWRLIWVCTVCQWPFYGFPGNSGLMTTVRVFRYMFNLCASFFPFWFWKWGVDFDFIDSRSLLILLLYRHCLILFIYLFIYLFFCDFVSWCCHWIACRCWWSVKDIRRHIFLLTLKAPVTTAADDIYNYFFIVFQRK